MFRFWSVVHTDSVFFEKKWKVSGKALVVKCVIKEVNEVGCEEKYPKKRYTRFEYHFECLEHNTLDNKIGICYEFGEMFLFTSPPRSVSSELYQVGDIVDVLSYDKKPCLRKLRGTYVSPVKPLWFIKAVASCLLALIILFVVYKCLYFAHVPQKKKRRRKRKKKITM